jgi:hypothetical protein
MKGKLTILKPDGSREITELDRKAELKELQAAVGGWIEIVPAFYTFEGNDCIVFCNEEGKADRLPINYLATAAWYGVNGPHGDVLVGDVLICQGDDEFMGAL